MEHAPTPNAKVMLPSKSFWVQFMIGLMIFIPAVVLVHVLILSPNDQETVARLGFHSDWYRLIGHHSSVFFAGVWLQLCCMHAIILAVMLQRAPDLLINPTMDEA
jgi:hypothetical protein